MDDTKEKALQSAISQIEKDHGKGALMKLGDGSAYPEIESVSTGSLTLDSCCLLYTSPSPRD